MDFSKHFKSPLNEIASTTSVIKFTGSVDDYGILTTTGSAVYQLNAYIVLLSSGDEEVKSGILNVGDARGYFHSADGSVLEPGMVVEYQNNKWAIEGEPRTYSIKSDSHTEVNLKRFHKP